MRKDLVMRLITGSGLSPCPFCGSVVGIDNIGLGDWTAWKCSLCQSAFTVTLTDDGQVVSVEELRKFREGVKRAPHA